MPPGQLSPRSSPDSAGDGQEGPQTLRGAPPLSLERNWGIRSANLWTTQLWREAVLKGAPCGAPPPLPWLPPPSSVQPLLVRVQAMDATLNLGRHGPLLELELS